MKKNNPKKAVKLDGKKKETSVGKSKIPNFYAPFKSLAGKEYENKEIYLVKKGKAEKSKFTLGKLLFDSSVEKVLKGKIGNRVKVEIEKGIDELIRKISDGKIKSKGYKYLADGLLTNRDKGYLGFNENYDSIKIENLERKNLPKTSGNGSINAPVSFELVKVK